jgi:hypothetical protein
MKILNEKDSKYNFILPSIFTQSPKWKTNILFGDTPPPQKKKKKSFQAIDYYSQKIKMLVDKLTSLTWRCSGHPFCFFPRGIPPQLTVPIILG